MRLCQAYRAKTKGKVEHDVSWVRERLFRGHSFTSCEDANIGWLAWNEEIARQRKHGTHGEIVAVRAERDHAALLTLPPTSYLVVDRTTRVVARDGLFSFEGRRYHVPDAKPGERVELLLGATELEVFSLWMAGGSRDTGAAGQPGSCLTRSRTRCRSRRSSAFPNSESIVGHLTVTRRRSMGELISERIRRNARELKLYGLVDTADELVDARRPGSSATASSSTSSSSPRSACSRAGVTRRG